MPGRSPGAPGQSWLNQFRGQIEIQVFVGGECLGNRRKKREPRKQKYHFLRDGDSDILQLVLKKKWSNWKVFLHSLMGNK